LQRRLTLADFLPDTEDDQSPIRRLIANSERELQDQLEADLNRRGFETLNEMVVVPRDRVDVAVYPNSDLPMLALIEVKTADPIRGVGQVLSYQVGAGEPTHCVLVTDWGVFNSQVARACTASGVELWAMREGKFRYITGPPTLWNAFRSPDEPVYEYEPFKPGPVETCECCEGAGKVGADVIDAKRFENDQRGVGKLRQGGSTGVFKIGGEL
jgi:hypothetical protein